MNTTRRSFFKTLTGLAAGLFSTKTLVGSQNSGQFTSKLEAVDAAKRAGSAADSAGVSFDAFTKQVTAAQEITARGGSVIGNALKTLYTRLREPKTIAPLTQHRIQTAGINRSRPADDVFADIAAKWSALSAADKNDLAETLGGVRQINIIRAIFNRPI